MKKRILSILSFDEVEGLTLFKMTRLVIKEWRRAQIAQAAPVVVTVPEPVQQAGSAAIAAIWLQAQDLANETLRNAQTAWETERAELDAMRQELAEAFELQAKELEAAEAGLTAHKQAAQQQAQELAAARQQLAEASSRADRAGARIAEIEHRAADLRAELDRAHADADRLRTENTEARKQAGAELEAAHTATDAAQTTLVKLQAQAMADAQAAAAARERAAGLGGQLLALQEQNAALLAALKAQVEPKPKRPELIGQGLAPRVASLENAR